MSKAFSEALDILLIPALHFSLCHFSSLLCPSWCSSINCRHGEQFVAFGYEGPFCLFEDCYQITSQSCLLSAKSAALTFPAASVFWAFVVLSQAFQLPRVFWEEPSSHWLERNDFTMRISSHTLQTFIPSPSTTFKNPCGALLPCPVYTQHTAPTDVLPLLKLLLLSFSVIFFCSLTFLFAIRFSTRTE